MYFKQNNLKLIIQLFEKYTEMWFNPARLNGTATGHGAIPTSINKSAFTRPNMTTSGSGVQQNSSVGSNGTASPSSSPINAVTKVEDAHDRILDDDDEEEEEDEDDEEEEEEKVYDH